MASKNVRRAEAPKAPKNIRRAEAAKNVKRAEAANALRTVTPDKAFYFYREIGQPLGVAPKSLAEFAAIVKDVDPSSITFHVGRGDFESWFGMLGDKSLAGQVATLRGTNISPNELRVKVTSIVRLRVDQLHQIASSK